MSGTAIGQKGLARWFQSKFILEVARRIFLAIASVSLLVAVFGLVVALVYELLSFRSAPQVPVPAAYAPQPIAMASGTVAQHLLPPRNLRFVVTPAVIDAPLSADQAVGYFNADTQNGIAPFPNDFDILGGPDAASFARVPLTVRYDGRVVSRAGLRPTETLRNEINASLKGLAQDRRRTFHLTVVAHDRLGTVSRPTTVAFTLVYGPASAAPPAGGTTTRLTDLQRLARAIALRLDPARTPVYFDAYTRALREPASCGTQDYNTDFVAGYRRAFEQLKGQLSASNMTAFYAGVCAAWEEGVAAENASEEAAAAARNGAEAKNAAAREAFAVERMGTQTVKYVALSVVVSAVTAFLLVAFLLAFLAIEKHSDALRQAVQTLADRERD